ncbi:hypothetical protein [Demequina iriomotensis]|uniref:hypothetical protein n=1 Tax=Demequina iriomotensis TaxID=1536641 RepID=UPI0012E0ACC4|nr:hypothetical protein [Demequina iriomotensis]
MATVGVGLAPAGAAEGDVVTDRVLASCVRTALDLTESDVITAEAMASLTALECDNYASIHSLTGLELATSLTSLRLELVMDAAVEPLATLTGLEDLRLPGADLGDRWDALDSLTGLRTVDLSNSDVTDLDWLATENLEVVDIGATAVTDLAPLSHAPIRWLSVGSTRLASLEPLGTLSSLETMWLSYAGVSDLSALRGLDQLAALHVSHNALTDLAPLATLPALSTLDVTYNGIADLTPVSHVAQVDARYQTIRTGAELCMPHQVTTPVDRDGGLLQPSRTVYIWDGAQTASGYTWIRPESEYSFSFTNSDGTFAGKVIETTGTHAGTVACAFESTPKPIASGTARAGSTLTAIADGWAPSVESLSYQWLRDGSAIGDATSGTYTLRSADVGHRVSVRVTAHRYGFASTSTTSSTRGVTATFSSSAKAKVTGSSIEGFTRTAATSGFPSGTAFRYQWLRDGKAITGATKKTFTLRHKDMGHKVTVKVTASKPGYTTRTLTPTATTVLGWMGDYSYTPLPASVRVGSTVSVRKPVFDVAASRYTYRWRRDGKPIAGATSRTYTARKADAGHRLTVAVTGHRTGYAPRTAIIGRTTARS